MPRCECNHEFFSVARIILSLAKDLKITAEPARRAVAPYQSDGMLGKFAKFFWRLILQTNAARFFRSSASAH